MAQILSFGALHSWNGKPAGETAHSVRMKVASGEVGGPLYPCCWSVRESQKAEKSDAEVTAGLDKWVLVVLGMKARLEQVQGYQRRGNENR